MLSITTVSRVLKFTGISFIIESEQTYYDIYSIEIDTCRYIGCTSSEILILIGFIIIVFLWIDWTEKKKKRDVLWFEWIFLYILFKKMFRHFGIHSRQWIIPIECPCHVHSCFLIQKSVLLPTTSQLDHRQECLYRVLIG